MEGGFSQIQSHIPKKKLADGHVAFLKQHPKDQERGSYNIVNFILILLECWDLFLYLMSTRQLKNSILLDEGSVETKHDKITNACTDNNLR